MTHWQNWSGSVTCAPREIAEPRSVEELARMVATFARNRRHIRVAGSGHSFTPLVRTDDVLISMEHLSGIESVNADAGTVTVLGGTRLKLLGDALLARGLAQENLGDIDVQTITGAISTGTHGTGIRFGTLSTQIAALTLITASGEILECSPERNPEIFKAAQVSLGALGIIARVELRVVPAKRLRFVSRSEPLATCLEHLEQYKRDNDHFEFFWFPYTPSVQVKFLNETDAPASGSNIWGELNKLVLENGVFWVLSECCRIAPPLARTGSRISAWGVAPVNQVDYSHKLFATPRMVRFQEMEYNIRAEDFPRVLADIRAALDRRRFNVHFPVECRFVRGDDIWLSPAYGRDSAYIAVHMYRGMPYRDYFAAVEEVYQRYDGRPHWGKMHTLGPETLAARYPHWHDFRRVRARLDPQGVFLNDYLRHLLAADEPVPAASPAQVEQITGGETD